jgi:hypothetical protein
VEQKAPGTKDASSEGESRLRLLAKVKKATGRDEITKLVDEYLRSYELPADVEFLEQALQHRDPQRKLEVMEQIERVLAEEMPKRRRGIVGQLKLIRDTGDDDEQAALAARLIDRLE